MKNFLEFFLPEEKLAPIHGLTDELLIKIFKLIDPVQRNRVRIAHPRWRRIFDDEDLQDELDRGEGEARLMVCDRRRCILERITSPPSCSSYAISDLSGVRTAIYHQDTFTPSALTINAYQFNFNPWISKFDICEVWLTNFGSFLERDQTPYVNSPLFYSDPKARGGPHRPGSYGATPPIDTANNRYPRAQPTHRSEGSSPPANAPNNTNNANNPYNQLSSSQKASIENLGGIAELDEEMSKELAAISAGRFEHLAELVKQIQPLNIIFNDHSFYQKRPTLLLFWFLKMLPNVKKLTFDSIMGVQQVELHKVVSLGKISELVIIQPPSNSCLIVTDDFLLGFLEQSPENRRRFRVRLEGKGATTVPALLKFIKKWQCMKERVEFHSILVDSVAVSPIDFVRAVTEPGDYNNNDTIDKEKEEIYQKRQLAFYYRWTRTCIKYKYEDGYLMFYYNDPRKPPKIPEPVIEEKPYICTFTSVSDKTRDEIEAEEQEKERQKMLAERTYRARINRFLNSFQGFAAVRTTA